MKLDRQILILSVLALSLGMPTWRARAASEPSSQAGAEFFEKHIRPVLVEHCYKCHSATSEKLKGGLFVDSKEGLLKGGDSGTAIVPGQPDKSLLITAIRWSDKEMQMPPKEPLEKEQIKAFE